MDTKTRPKAPEKPRGAANLQSHKKSRLFLGVWNGPIQFKSARKIWPLPELLAKITRVLACSCLQNFCNCSHALILVKMCSIARNFVNPAL